MDECFGDFIAFLKRSPMYDSSIIIVTSDHGDSLGEDGRWGHAYTVFPEILKIPLIIHLPAAWAQAVAVDPSSPAFLTDLSPSLYYLLGYRNLPASDLVGRSLFTVPGDTTPVVARPHLVASSYGPVYGELSADLGTLYIADALNFTDYLYKFDASGKSHQSSITAATRKDYREWIQRHVDAVNRFYHLNN
jgi:phosphoglycerol transferase MdoB-like AlkP superfamily enzyme